ncbi:MAG: hypothetical protein ACOY4T_08770 [Pseudomonadota bacterium]
MFDEVPPAVVLARAVEGFEKGTDFVPPDPLPDTPEDAVDLSPLEGSPFTEGAGTPEVETLNDRFEADLKAGTAPEFPAGEGPFGPILSGFEGDWKGAIRELTRLRTGEATAALSHPDIGKIDLIWGAEGTGRGDGFGLAKIARFHPEVLGDLQRRLDAAKVASRSENRIRLEGAQDEFAVRLDYDGQSKTWLLTAYEKQPAAGRSTARPGVMAESSSPSGRLRGEDSPAAPSDQGDPIDRALAEARARPDFAAAGVEFDQKGGIVTTVGDLLDGLDRDRALIDALRVCNRGGGAA